VRLQIIRINVESFFEVQSGRADVARQECILRTLDFLEGFRRNEQLAH